MDRRTECDVLSRKKDAVVLGTYDSNAFILSLRRPDEFSTTHSFGYHRVPHIGVYGSEYNLALPMVLLSLPATPRYLERLPYEVLNALDLSHLIGHPLTSPPPPPPSPRHLLSQRIISTLHTHRDLSGDRQLMVIARELVRFAIDSAIARLGLTATLRDTSEQHHLQLTTSYRDEKRPSVVSMASVESEGGGSEAVARHQPKTVSIQVEATVINEDEVGSGEEGGEEGEYWELGEDTLRLGAKKIVNKALHLACKRWESMNRRSSIDYLIASTKRLKIASPSPPPTVPEEGGVYEYGVAASMRHQSAGGCDTPSPTPNMAAVHHGKKRNRSESHDTMMMKELELFRRAQMEWEGGGGGGGGTEERVLARPNRRGSQGGKRGSVQFLQQGESIGELITDIHRMSIQNADSESVEEQCSSDEDYTILSGVTKPASNSDGSTTDSPVPPPNSPTSLQVVRGGANRCPSPLLLHHTLPPALPGCMASRTGTSEENTTCTSPEFQQKLPTLQPVSSPSRLHQEPVLILPRDSAVPEMDYYIILHTHPPPGVCQKFLCDNTDEVNLLYHCWLYPDVPCDPSVVCSRQLEMGIFQPHGVAPVHQDLQDAGVAFHHLQPRTVCIHSCHFSPENAQLQLLGDQQLHTFFSAARDGGQRRVVALHLVPGSGGVEERLREGLGGCSTLTELLELLSLVVPNSTEIIRNLILP